MNKTTVAMGDEEFLKTCDGLGPVGGPDSQDFTIFFKPSDNPKVDNWKKTILTAVEHLRSGDSSFLDMLARHLDQCEAAKYELHRKGYGVAGTPLLQAAIQVPAYE